MRILRSDSWRVWRYTLIGPDVTALDFSIFKNNRIPGISENFNIQFRAETFNILNHPNFASPGPETAPPIFST